MSVQFTRRDLFCLLAVVGVSSLCILPAIQVARRHSARATLLKNAHMIHLVVFTVSTSDHVISWEDEDRRLHIPSGFFRSSTDYARYMVLCGTMYPPFLDLFGGGGVPSFKGTNAHDFSAANNAWNVVADQTDWQTGPVPFIFTRNLPVLSLPEVKRARLASIQPLGEWGVVVQYMGGQGRFIHQQDVANGISAEQYTNRVLQP
jgi:hypothetical protein